MCGTTGIAPVAAAPTTNVAGVAGGGLTAMTPPAPQGLETAAGNAAAEAYNMAVHAHGADGTCSAMAQAAAGALPVAGGGGTDALSTALTALTQALEGLKAVLAKLTGTQVAGVQGQQAATTQFVARTSLQTTYSTSEDNGFENRVVELINQERAKQGLAPVSYNGQLDNAAEKHADHMAKVGSMAHDGIGDGDPGERIRSEGFAKGWGENVATGQTSPEQVVQEWMNSPTHRRNILDPSFRQMGVAYTTAANGRSYWAQEFGAA